MLIGAHVPSSDPVGEAGERGAQVVQVFLSSPQMWRPPKPKPDAWRERVVASGLPLYVHAPYLCNPASANPEVRRKSAELLQATLDEASRVGAGGVVVHAGSYGAGATLDEGCRRWVEVAARLSSDVPLLVENVAKGATSLGRYPDQFAALWAALTGAEIDVAVGLCLDTNHAWESGGFSEPSAAAAEAFVAAFRDVAGQVALVHANDSKHPEGAGRDHHDNFGAGTIPAEVTAAMLAAAGCEHVVVETPGGAVEHAADIAYLAALGE